MVQGRELPCMCSIINSIQKLLDTYYVPDSFFFGQSSDIMFSNGWLTGEGGSGMDEKGEGE